MELSQTKQLIEDGKKLIITTAIAELTKPLTQTEQEVLLGILVNNQSFKQIGADRLLTEKRIKQIYSTALTRLNTRLNAVNADLSRKAALEIENSALKALLNEVRQTFSQLNFEVSLKDKKDEAVRNLPEKTQKLLTADIRELPLPVRMLTACKQEEIKTLGDLVQYQRYDLFKFRNMGNKTVVLVDKFLADHNLKWGMF